MTSSPPFDRAWLVRVLEKTTLSNEREIEEAYAQADKAHTEWNSRPRAAQYPDKIQCNMHSPTLVIYPVGTGGCPLCNETHAYTALRNRIENALKK